MVPALAATSSADKPSPHKVTALPTLAWGMSLKSAHSMSMDTRPTVLVRLPATTMGVLLSENPGACRGYPSA